MKYTPENIKKLAKNEIFVFGSNEAGIHGKGAALDAKLFFNAINGVGEGLQGQSYAIPTKDQNLNPLPLKQINNYLKNFICFAREKSDKTFYMTKIGTGLSKYSISDIAPLFYIKKIPSNVVLPEEFVLTKDKIKIISGGQTGIDRMALESAKEFGFKTGGLAPKGYRTETGNDFSLKKFGIEEDVTSNYQPRTKKNIINSNATVLLGNPESSGSKLTIKYANELNKKIFINPDADRIAKIIAFFNCVNFAGNRLSVLKEKAKEYKKLLILAFKILLKDFIK